MGPARRRRSGWPGARPPREPARRRTPPAAGAGPPGGVCKSRSVDLSELEALAAEDGYLAVVATTRADATVQASVVNAGFAAHPVGGDRQVAFVTYGPVKLANLRRTPRATVVFRAGWRWGAVEGPCELIGPDDAVDGFDPGGLAELLREVFRSAGGSHDDWDAYDRVMREQRRTAVFIRPERIYSNRT